MLLSRPVASYAGTMEESAGFAGVARQPDGRPDDATLWLKDLGEKTGLWQSEISKYETGAVVPEMGAMIAISRAFNEMPPLLSMAMRRYLESPFSSDPEQALVAAGSFG
jgi:transcriptional regulator with XRE-family HTH domain